MKILLFLIFLEMSKMWENKDPKDTLLTCTEKTIDEKHTDRTKRQFVCFASCKFSAKNAHAGGSSNSDR